MKMLRIFGGLGLPSQTKRGIRLGQTLGVRAIGRFGNDN